ncbi:hypothetical protein GCM10023079_08880 [Streptomyces chitinivorans]
MGRLAGRLTGRFAVRRRLFGWGARVVHCPSDPLTAAAPAALGRLNDTAGVPWLTLPATAPAAAPADALRLL